MQCKLGNKVNRRQRKCLFSCYDCDHSIIKGEAIQRRRQAVGVGEAIDKGLRISRIEWFGGIDVEAGVLPAHEVIGDLRRENLAFDHKRKQFEPEQLGHNADIPEGALFEFWQSGIVVDASVPRAGSSELREMTVALLEGRATWEEFERRVAEELSLPPDIIAKEVRDKKSYASEVFKRLAPRLGRELIERLWNQPYYAFRRAGEERPADEAKRYRK